GEYGFYMLIVNKMSIYFSSGQYHCHSGFYTNVCGEEVNANDYKPDPLEILDHVKINNTLESPISTIKGVLKDSKEKDLSFNKENFMNLSAFYKIIKKYEKITSRSASRSYMKIVDKSYLGSSDEATEVMKSLKPKQKREKHSITFLSVLLMESGKLIDKEQGTLYMENIFPLHNLYAYIVLHMHWYAANICLWRRYRINYPFIFGFKQGTELGYREVVLLSTGLAVLALPTFLAHLHLDSRTRDYRHILNCIIVVVEIFLNIFYMQVVLVITFCPFNILYRSSYFFLIRCRFRCVTLPDFFLVDQLTSQIEAFRSFEFYICYYGLSEFSQRRNKCQSHDAYNVFYFIVAVIPYWICFLQCLCHLFKEKDASHEYNGLRYFLTIVAIFIRMAFELRKGISWKVLAVISSAVATLMNTYWDIVVDWGLLQRTSKNLSQRYTFSFSQKCILCSCGNIFARLQLMLKFNLCSLRGKTISSIIACLEILRHGMWNCFRLENEHLNNVGKYRAFKSVPLPFNYYDEDIDKDD
ncbi:hypothetical protein LOK49_LG11G01096, partial [Camellia lanceoleosa]